MSNIEIFFQRPPFYSVVAKFNPESACESGAYADFAWKNDPKHLLFTMAIYKFCAKLLDGAKLSLEIECGDLLCSSIMLQSVERMVGIDIQELIEQNTRLEKPAYGVNRMSNLCHNITTFPLKQENDFAVSLDVLKHIPAEFENDFIGNSAASQTDNAVCTIGTPNIAASSHASDGSVQEHVNLKDSTAFKSLLLRHFQNVFLFSMNNEVVHTGFYPMAVAPRRGDS